jgi:signal transduction histidine kinase
MAMIDAVHRRLTAEANSRDFLNRICQLTTSVMGCGHSFTALWETKEQAYVPAAGHGYTTEEWEALRVLRLPPTQLMDVLARLDRYDVVALTPENGALAALATAPPGTTSLWMAVRCGGAIVGIHIATFDKPAAIDSPRYDERLSLELAHLASLAIENARLVEELRDANQLKSDFVATILHELRTPLNHILGYTDLVLEAALGPLTAEQAGALHSVQRSGGRLLDLVNATLDVSRLDTGALPVDVLPTTVSEVLAEVEADTRQLGARRIVWNVPPDLPPIETDRVKLKLVVTNLVDNAVKFTPEGSVTVAAGTRENGVEISVTDTGIGIPPEALSSVFEPFRRGHDLPASRAGGVGLGLYIVRRFLDLLGGTIEVESQVGSGSTFRVWVPSSIASCNGQTTDELVSMMRQATGCD